VGVEKVGEDHLVRSLRNEVEIYRDNEERNVIHTMNGRRPAKWTGRFCCRNCLGKNFYEGKIELVGRRGK